MSRTTIDFGIHLGTSFSAIAVLEDAQIKVIKNNDGLDLTPSAVYIDKNNNLIVGRAARLRLDSEPEDAYSEFKLRIGTDHQYRFSKSGRVMRPEDLTAEVIKSLGADVRQHLGEELEAAVITVPAAFELPQCQATQEAARMAGLKTFRLIQEPVAAAMSYAFKNNLNEGYWLICDFLSSTFSATLLRMRDNNFRILHHAVDNHLGNSLIDWDVVDKLLVPAVVSMNPVTNFQRGNPKWRKAFMKLKREVEEAKIQLTQKDSWIILFDYLCNDDNGEPVAFEFELKRQDVDRLIEPYIQRIVQTSRQVLEERLLDSSDVSQLIYVGDPVLAPFLRQPFAHPSQGLGLTLEDSIDPWTILAQGAAVFAGSTSLDDQSAEAWTKDRRFKVSYLDQEAAALPVEELVPASQDQEAEALPVEELAPASLDQEAEALPAEELAPASQDQEAGALPVEELSLVTQDQESGVLPVEEVSLAPQDQETVDMPVEEFTPASQGVDLLSSLPTVEEFIPSVELPGLVLCQSCREQVETVVIGERTYCVNCGVAMPDPQAQSKRDRTNQITSTEMRCPLCMLRMLPVHISGKYYCPECGIDLKV